MNKRNINYTIVAIVGLISLFALFTSCTNDGSKPLEYEPHNPNYGVTTQPNSVDIYLDVSGSMKGYVDGVQGAFKKNVTSLITTMTNKNSLGLQDTSVRCHAINDNKVSNHTADQFREKIIDNTFFSGKSTEMHTMFDIASMNVLSDTNKISILITDGILSFKNAKGTEKNIEDIAKLQSDVTNSMTKLVNNDLSVAVVQYHSDFNGNYYFYYRDEKLQIAKDQTMKQRPYYFILIGSRSKVESMFSKNALPDDYVGIYMFNKDATHPQYQAIRALHTSNVPKISDNVISVKINNANKKKTYFYLAVKDFSIPPFVDTKVMDAPKFKGDLIDSVVPMSFNDFKVDNQYNSHDTLRFSFLYKVTLKDNEQLRNNAALTDEVFFVPQSLDVDGSNIENDLVDSLADLEGRTFMFAKFIEAINDAYPSLESRLAVIDIKIVKEQK